MKSDKYSFSNNLYFAKISVKFDNNEDFLNVKFFCQNIKYRCHHNKYLLVWWGKKHFVMKNEVNCIDNTNIISNIFHGLKKYQLITRSVCRHFLSGNFSCKVFQKCFQKPESHELEMSQRTNDQEWTNCRSNIKCMSC